MKIPYIGFGTNIVKSPEIIKNAIKVGYRHFDTATFYNNISLIGKCINNSGIKREDFFVTSKLWTDEHGYKECIESVKEEIKKSELGYLDLYLIHSPIGGKLVETYKALFELRSEGLLRNIGVSNFEMEHLIRIHDNFGCYPKINQIEFNIKNQNKELIRFCKQRDIKLCIYSPFSKGDMEIKILEELEKKYKVNRTVIILSWIKMKKFDSVLIHSSNLGRMTDNFSQNYIKLDLEDINLLNNLNEDKTCTDWHLYR